MPLCLDRQDAAQLSSNRPIELANELETKLQPQLQNGNNYKSGRSPFHTKIGQRRWVTLGVILPANGRQVGPFGVAV